MKFSFMIILFSVGFFLSLIGAVRLGWLHGRRSPQSADSMEGLRGTEAAMFGMLGLLLAFTFYGAASRFDERRHLAVDEANAIGTAYLRLDYLPEPVKMQARDLFRLYVDQRLATLELWQDSEKRDANEMLVKETQAKIWTLIVSAINSGKAPLAQFPLTSAMNEMFDIENTRMMYVKIHPPNVIYALLTFIALICACIAGYSMARYPALNWMHVFGFALMLSLTFFVILEVEYPRDGLIQLNGIDQAMVDLRKSMN